MPMPYDLNLLQRCSNSRCPNFAHHQNKCLLCLGVDGIRGDHLGNWGKSLTKGRFTGTYKGRHRAVSRIVYEVISGIEINQMTVIHHKNENPLDNRFENLESMSSDEHNKLHAEWRLRNNKQKLKCKKCNKYLKLRNFKIKDYDNWGNPKRRSTCRKCQKVQKLLTECADL